jgi:hypothetical protein
MVARIGESKNSRRILVKNISSEMSTWNNEVEGNIKVVFERCFLTIRCRPLRWNCHVLGVWWEHGFMHSGKPAYIKIGEYYHPFCIKNTETSTWHICLFAKFWELQTCPLCSLALLQYIILLTDTPYWAVDSVRNSTLVSACSY